MSHPEPAWHAFLLTVIKVTVVLVATLFVLIVVVDPHDHLLLSPSFERAPINTNQRFSYPAIAREGHFDSAVFGTSTARLLEPRILDEHFGGRFANLSMNSATAYEQSRIFELFLRRRAQPRTVILGVDVVWCETGERYEKYTFREFPEWLYDDNAWNDFLHLLDGNTLEQTGRQLEFLAGRRAPRYGFDGFENFLEARNTYDFQRALTNLYGPQGPRPKAAGPAEPALTAEVVRGWNFPTHGMLDTMLTALPADTLKVLFFVPYHYFSQPARWTGAALRWQECKRRISAIAERHPNTHVLDFMIGSEITRRDENYWDPLHFSLTVGHRIIALLAAGAHERRGQPDLFDYLGGQARAARGAPGSEDHHEVGTVVPCPDGPRGERPHGSRPRSPLPSRAYPPCPG